jgi:hypothetical protein
LAGRYFDFGGFFRFSGSEPVTTRKNLSVKLISREIRIFQNPINSTFSNLNAKLNFDQLVKTLTWLGDISIFVRF